MSQEFSRRSFLQGTGVVAAGLAAAGLTACAPSAPAADKKEELSATGSDTSTSARWSWEVAPEPIADDQIAEVVETDFLVIGAGIAGVSTACSLAENGGKVTVIEKCDTFSCRGGHYGSVNSSFWKSLGVEHDPADIARSWVAQCNSRGNERLMWTFLNRSGEAMDWAVEKCERNGAIPLPIDAVYKGPTYEEFLGTILFVPGDNAFEGANPGNIPCTSIYNDAVAAGVQFVFNTRAEQLVKDGDRVVGVVASTDDGYKKYVGAKAVILATGDISGDDEMCEAYSPLMIRCEQTQYVPLGANTGDGQKMGMWIGAKMEDTPLAPMIHPQAYVRISHYFLSVSSRGERYMNEDVWAQGKALGALTAPGNSDHAYSIFDSTWLDNMADTIEIGGGMFWQGSGSTYQSEYNPENDQKFLDEGLESGMVKQGNTVEELADAIAADEPEFDKQAFIDEFNRYNQLCRDGKDVDFGKRSELLFELATPPFYAAKFGGCRMVAPGGLLINTKSQVLDTNDYPIEGLYAVGNVSGGLYAVDYPLVVPGNSHGRAVTFGWLLGRQLTGVE